MCTDSKGVVNNFGFKYRNEANNTLEILEHLQAKILDIPYDIIIGRPTIVEHQLLHKLSTHFSEENVASGGAPTRSSNHSAHDVTAAFGQPTVPEDHPALNVLYKKDELLTPEYDDDGIELKVKDFPWEKEDTPITQNGNENAPKPQPTIHGSPELQARIRSLLAEFDDIFSTDLKPQPAMVPPMDVKVDKTQWHKPRNRLLPRTQTHEKNAEIERQIRKMVAAKVIKPSQASHYSQVQLTPKPNGKWRFCIDYRLLNECCASMGWPIPNIKQMLQRLGQQRAKYYAVMDLTSGYHQSPLGRSSQEASAFITFMGSTSGSESLWVLRVHHPTFSRR